MIAVTSIDGVSSYIFPDVATALIASARSKDKYLIQDSHKRVQWKNQSWCDHNVLGFYLGPTCKAFEITIIKESLDFYNSMLEDRDG